MSGTTGADRPTPVWQYDEVKHAGVDYADVRVAEKYDERHSRFRDFEKAAKVIIERLGLKPTDSVIDLGCGTGAFVLTAARHCRKVHAVDVSPAMLELLRRKAQGLENVKTHHAGFLTYRHEDEPADAVVSVAALHHLPDFWKAVALKRIAEMLRPGGRFYLFDVVFSFPVEKYRPALDAWIGQMGAAVDSDMGGETVIHVRDEHSTFEWIMDGLLERAGFRIEQKFVEGPQCLAYVCRREG